MLQVLPRSICSCTWTPLASHTSTTTISPVLGLPSTAAVSSSSTTTSHNQVVSVLAQISSSSLP
jgi:hypothetical protein